MGKPVIALIEWRSTSGINPAVILADDHAGARRAAAKFLIGYLPTPAEPAEQIELIDLAWVAANPAPDLNDADAVEAWLRVLNTTTTDAWVSLMEAAVGDEPTKDAYADVRT